LFNTGQNIRNDNAKIQIGKTGILEVDLENNFITSITYAEAS